MRMLCLGRIEIGATGDALKVPIRYGATHCVVVAPRYKTHALFAIVRHEDGETARTLLERHHFEILHDSAGGAKEEQATQADFRAMTLRATDVEREFWKVFSVFQADGWAVSLNYLPNSTP